MNARKMKELRDQALAEKAAKEKEAADAAAKRKSAWDCGRPERRLAESKMILEAVEAQAKLGLSKLVVNLGHKELCETFKKLGYTVRVHSDRVEEQECVNYENGVYVGTGRYEDRHTLTLEW